MLTLKPAATANAPPPIAPAAHAHEPLSPPTTMPTSGNQASAAASGAPATPTGRMEK
jgi:hypothetical protein